MRNFWRGVARFLAVIMTILFVISAVAALFLVAIDRRLLSPATYKNAMSRQQIYARLPRVLAEQFYLSLNSSSCSNNPLTCPGASPEFLACAANLLGTQRYTALTGGQDQPTQAELTSLQACLDKYPLKPSPAGGEQPALLKNLSLANWETIITNLFPPEALRRTTEDLIDQIFAYYNGRQAGVAVNLTDLKDRVGGQAGLESVLELLRAQPACSGTQLQQMQAVLVNASDASVFCRPPEDELTQLKPSIQLQLINYVSSLPDQWILVSPQSSEIPAAGGPPGTSDPVAAFRRLHLLLRLSPDPALGFLLLVSLLAVRSPKSWLRWWGIPLFLSGGISILLAILAFGSFERGWLSLLAAGKVPQTVSLGAITLAHDLARAVLQSLLAGILIGSALLGLLGLGMWIGSAFLKDGAAPGGTATPPAAKA